MMQLAGLIRVEYVFAFPDEKDIVIAGPAEGWIQSPAGHIVGIQSGLPTLHLEDLTTALHVFTADRTGESMGRLFDRPRSRRDAETAGIQPNNSTHHSTR